MTIIVSESTENVINFRIVPLYKPSKSTTIIDYKYAAWY